MAQPILAKWHMTHMPPTVLNVSSPTRVHSSPGSSRLGSCEARWRQQSSPKSTSEGPKQLDVSSSPFPIPSHLTSSSSLESANRHQAGAELSRNAGDGEATLSHLSKRLSPSVLPPPLPAPTRPAVPVVTFHQPNPCQLSSSRTGGPVFPLLTFFTLLFPLFSLISPHIKAAFLPSGEKERLLSRSERQREVARTLARPGRPAGRPSLLDRAGPSH